MDVREIHILSTGIPAEEPAEKDLPDGFVLDILPFIKIEERLTPELVKQLQLFAGQQRTVIFTSKQAVDRVVAVLSTPPDWQIYCINGATCEAVTRFWGEKNIKDRAVNGALLATKICEQYQGDTGTVLFFCGRQRLHEIPGRLSRQKIPFREIVLYDTLMTPHKPKKSYAAILFFSPSGVDSFFSENRSGEAILFSIGETTTKALRKYVTDDSLIVTAGRPDKKELLETAINYFRKEKQ